MKISELEGEQLDNWVAKALGGVLDGDGWRFDPPVLDGVSFLKTKRSFCESWEYGGPIIEREKITLLSNPGSGKVGEWEAQVNSLRTYDGPESDVSMTGTTPLIAAMRAFVASKFGEEVGE